MLDETAEPVVLDDAPSDGVDPSPVSAERPATAPKKKVKVNRFDRPKPPHDWRWAIAGIGRVLISVGVLMFGFVAYQLWGTAIQEAAAQNKLENRLEERSTGMTLPPFNASTLPPATTTPDGSTDTTAPDGSTPTASTLPGETVTPTSGPDGPSGTDAPTDPSTESTTAPPPEATTAPNAPVATAPPPLLPPPEPAREIGTLQIPSIGVDKVFVEGVTRSALQDGPGHIVETPLPGQFGNAVIAGHRVTFGQPFYDIDKIEVGDDVIVSYPTPQGDGVWVYTVTETNLIEDAADAYAAFVPTLDWNSPTITLISCHPKRSTSQRIAVKAVLDPARSSIVTQPFDLGPLDPTSEIPLDEVPPPASDSPPATEAPPPSADALSSWAGSHRALLPMQTDDDPVGESESALEEGWFDDSAAWPHVAGWGALLSLIGIGAWLLSRKVKRNWVGALAGIVPFVVTLYFFYENLNRLLPPGL